MIKLARLINNQPVIGEVVEENGQQVMLDPHTLALSMPTPTDVLVSFVPLGTFVGAPQVKEILRAIMPPVKRLPLTPHVLLCPIEDAPADMEREYLSFTSGIQVVAANTNIHLVK